MQSARPSRQELRSSFMLPIVITLAIWAAGTLIYLLSPHNFNDIISLLIGLCLFIYLWRWTRQVEMRLRLPVVIFALPSLIGITMGMTRGNVQYTLFGFGITVILLMGQRLLHTPLSYRAAMRYSRQGNDEDALVLLGKAIETRPDFWQSYQLRTLIFLVQGHLMHAERDGKTAVTLNPRSHEAHNILGQVYLAQTAFEEAVMEYETAVSLAPTNVLYAYYLGISLYRNGRFAEAAHALAIATQGSLPTESYDLLAYFYLARALAANNEEAIAAEAYKMMNNFINGLPALEKQYAEQVETPHLSMMKKDLGIIQHFDVG